MTNKKPVVSILTTDQGHKSLSDTIAKTLGNDYEVHTFSDDNFMFAYYIFIYRFFPKSTKLPFLMFQNPLLRLISSISLDLQYRGKIKKFLRETKPDIVINVFWMFRPSLDAELKNTKIKYLNIITDPWTVHPFVASKIAHDNLAFDKHTVSVIEDQLEKVNLSPIGWFVRDAFEETFVKKEVREKLKLKRDELTILFTTGSEGTEQVLPILSEVISSPKNVQIVVACGKNENLREKVLNLNKKAPGNISIHAIPFTTQLHKYMQAADLVIGKAGPNSVFEAIATHTPFFATTHIAGQEDGNLDIIKHFKVGYVEENTDKASKLLLKIINDPKQLNQFEDNLKKLAEYNRGSKKYLLEKVKN